MNDWIYKEEHKQKHSTQVIHLWSGNPNFCGSKDKGRRFVFTVDEVTCEQCRKNHEANTHS